MINKADIETARRRFLRASSELGFKIISPFYADDIKLYAFAFMPDYGSVNGAVLLLANMHDFHEIEENTGIIEWAKKHGCFYSILNIQPLLEEYNREYFTDILNDWKIFKNN